MLDRLEERGAIVRERPGDNRRVVQVRITPQGLSLLGSLSAPLRDCHAKQLGHLPAEKLQQLCELLREARQPHEAAESHWS